MQDTRSCGSAHQAYWDSSGGKNVKALTDGQARPCGPTS